jgi:hypothetical protein
VRGGGRKAGAGVLTGMHSGRNMGYGWGAGVGYRLKGEVGVGPGGGSLDVGQGGRKEVG